MKKNLETKSKLIKFFKENINLYRTVNSEDNEIFLTNLKKILPIKIIKIKSGTKLFSWKVPKRWKLIYGYLKDSRNKILLSHKDSSLFVQTFSRSVNKMFFTKKELKKHTLINKINKNAFSYYSKLAYQFYIKKDFKISLPHNYFKKLQSRNRLEIKSKFTNKPMLLGEYYLKGKSEKTIILIAHYCHPGQLDDGLGGVAMMTEMYNFLSGRKNYYSYLFIFVPETIGSLAYFVKKKSLRNKIVGGIFCEAPGKKNSLFIKYSENKDSIIDFACEHFVKLYKKKIFEKNFHEPVGNDEMILADPDINIPIVSFQRWPFSQYHTSNDNIKNFDFFKFNETLSFIKEVINIVEFNFKIKRNFKGPLYLSGYNLYVEPSINMKKYKFIWKIMHYSGKNLNILDISNKLNLKFDEVFKILKIFKEKKLIKFLR